MFIYAPVVFLYFIFITVYTMYLCSYILLVIVDISQPAGIDKWFYATEQESQ